MKKIIYIIIGVCWLGKLFPQGIDSLYSVWKDKSKHDTVRAMALHIYSRKMVFSYPDSTLKYSKQLLRFCDSKELVKYKVGAINNIALSYYAKGDYVMAIDNYANSVSILKKMYSEGDTTNKVFARTQLGKTYNNIGNVYLDKGDYPKALDFYFQSLKIVEEMGDVKAQSVSFTNIGIIYGIQKNHPISISYFLKSLQMDSLLGDKMGEANNYSNIGNLYQEAKDYENSQSYQEKSLALRREINDKGGEGLSLISLGSLFLEKGFDLENKGGNNSDSQSEFYRKSYGYYSEGLKISQEMGDKNNEAIALIGMGNIQIKLGEVNSGISFCENSLQIAEAINTKGDIRDACNCLYKGYSKLKNYPKALKYLERFISIRDTLNSEEKIREIAQKQFEFDYTKKAVADSLKTQEQRIIIQAELKHEQSQRYFLYGGLALVMVFAGFMFNRFKVTKRQKSIIEKQKTIVEEKQKEIVDSIQYAKRIQKALLAHDTLLENALEDFFILYKPKDIVSGDFYWASNVLRKAKENSSKKDLVNGQDTINEEFYLAVCDSTGHGVPGAFMSLLNSTLLNEAINEKRIKQPGEILDYVRLKLISNMAQEGQKDGMDGVLLNFNLQTKEVTYAAANNKPVLISENKIIELSSNKMPIGQGEKMDAFTTYNLSHKKGDTLYLYTDGYADQFGGEKGKKFKYKKLEALLFEIHSKSMDEQKEILNFEFDKWKGGLEQVDDVCILGIRL